MADQVHVECVGCGAVYDQRLMRREQVYCCGVCGSDQIEVTNSYLHQDEGGEA